jgi:glucose-6-phosphate-specific signal transduction histidine kinase
LELRRFDGEDGATALAAMVFERTAGSPHVADTLHRSLAEIGENVWQHSGQPHGYMAAVLTYGGRRIQFAVADAGRGLTHNLQRFGSTSDDESLEMALQGGVSSAGEPARGTGIRDTRQLVTALQGDLTMITRTAGRIVTAKSTRVIASPLAPFPGTLLQGSLVCGG